MSLAERDLVGPGAEAELDALLALQRASFQAAPDPSLAERKANLSKLRALLVTHQDALAQAVNQDFSARSVVETRAAEIYITVNGIKGMIGQLGEWMRPRWRHVDLTMAPAKARVHYQPKGVVGIIAPWNYPVQLTMLPLATALAAGNRVMIKPSELTPATSALMAKLLHEAFPREVVAVVQGDASVGTAFSKLAFDHMFFTGSTAVGKHVMRAAAENLVPVTLELGGKSPTLIHRGFDLDRAAARIAYGKLLNAGQTCIAPDYVMVHSSERDAFVEAYRKAVTALYPTVLDNSDYTSIVNERHHQRLVGLLSEASAKGATVVSLAPPSEDFSAVRKLPPTVVLDGTPEMGLLQDEIFGPVLPIVTYETLDEAIRYIVARPRPLALYYFDNDSARADHVLRHTHSGGACINDVIVHIVIEDLPFGGVGPSGMGAYHGFDGFEEFSHKKSVVLQRKLNFMSLFAPPYGTTIDRLLGLLIR